jgi:hypothetical protein
MIDATIKPSYMMIHPAIELSSMMLHAQRSIVDSKKLTDIDSKKTMQ